MCRFLTVLGLLFQVFGVIPSALDYLFPARVTHESEVGIPTGERVQTTKREWVAFVGFAAVALGAFLQLVAVLCTHSAHD